MNHKYLSAGKQATKVNNVKNWTSIMSTMFHRDLFWLHCYSLYVYINEIPKILEKCEVVLYAVDTLIFTEANDQICYNNLEIDLNNVNKWIKINKLKLNECKTKVMEINMNSNIQIKINSEQLDIYGRIRNKVPIVTAIHIYNIII